jgi:outer membrane lipoprotein-sorting protein
MKKIVLFLSVLLFLTPSGFCLEPVAILGRTFVNYQILKEFQTDLTMGISMLGNQLAVTGSLFRKGSKVRVDLKMPIPGMDKPDEKILIFDQGVLTQYQPLMKLAVRIDFTQLPAELKEQFKNKFAENFPALLAKISSAQVKEVTKDGAKFYLLEIVDLDKLSGQTSAPLKFSMKKVLLWVGQKDFIINRIEFFGESPEPGLWLEFKNLQTTKIPEEKFILQLPDDTEIMDMTGIVKNMVEGMAKKAETSSETAVVH